TITGAYSGDSNHGGGSGSVNQVVTASNGNVSVSSGLNPSAYGQSVTFTATITGDNGMAKRRNGAKPQNVSGTVTWSDSNGALICTESGTSTTTITSGYPGVATCTLSTLAVNPSDTITGNYSGDANHNAGSGTVMQTINAAGANVSVASSLNPSVYGESVTFTATINGANGLFRARRNGKKAQDVTGSVTWNDSNGPLTCTESSSSTTTVTPGNPGTATCTTAALAVASSDTITANYGGDSNHNTGTGTVSQEVDASGTTVSVASGLNPQVYGQPVTFTATINAASGALKGRKNGAKPMDVTGNVQWSADTGCGSTPVTPTGTGVGTATCTTSILPGGTDAITANYLGDANHGAGSGTLGGGEEIDPASQTTTFTTPAPASATYNTSFTVAATASSGLTVTFGVGAGSVCTNVGATFTMTSGTGSCTVVASQAGNGNYLAAPAAYGVAGAVPAIQTITVSVPAPAKADYASSFTIVATTNSGLPVQFGLGTSKQSNCTNVAGTYTMMSKNGYCYETINAAGNSNYSAAPEVDEHTQVTPPINPTVSFTGAPASAAYLSTFTVTASSTNDPNAPTIKTTGGCKVNSTADDGTTATAVIAITTGTGTCTMTANWAATATYAAHTATQKTTAEKATPVITWATPSPITYGTTLSGILDATANVAGTFVYKVNGTTVTATKVLAAGTYPLTATFTPTLTADYTTATDTVTLVVNQAATTTTITTTSPNPSAVNKAVKVSFTVTPGKPTGSVTVTASTGETCTGTVSSSGTGYCSITFTTSGARTLIASYSGDASNEASVSAGFTQTVN
ncbi:MAG: Ig-like domain-containing protein, partial [Terriglobales bacterium]